MVQYILSLGADVNYRDPNGDTALFLSVLNEQFDTAKLLIDFGADPDMRELTFNSTPLPVAALNKDVRTVQLLLSAGADVNLRNCNEFTPLQMMVFGDANLKIAKSVLDAGVDISARNIDGCTAVHDAALKGNLELMKLLLDAAERKTGHDGEALQSMIKGQDATSYFITPLHLSAFNGNVEVARLLLNAGADAHAKTLSGKTPLHYAAKFWRLDVAKLLLERGAEITADKEGQTPLHIAELDASVRRAAFFVEDVKEGDCKPTYVEFDRLVGNVVPYQVAFIEYLVAHGASQ